MSTPTAPIPCYTVALQGFSDFERQALASFFRLAAQRSPAYVQVGPVDHGDFVIADADHQSALDAVQTAGRALDTVFVGSKAPEGAMAWLPRPIDPMHIVRELDALVTQRRAAQAGFDQTPLLAGVDLLLHEMDLPSHGQRSAGPRRADHRGSGRDVLIVEDSAIARKFLQLRLQRLGYRVHLAHTGAQALELNESQPFSVVFLDIVLGDADSLDGLQVCQAIRQTPSAFEGHSPAIVMVTGSSSAADRVRGQLAGCNAYLTKPLIEAEFMATLRQVDPAFDRGSEMMAL